MAHPAEDLEAQQPVEQIEVDPNNVEADLEGAESRYGGYGRGFGYGGYGKKTIEVETLSEKLVELANTSKRF